MIKLPAVRGVQRDERGYSLIEMLVVMVVLGVVLGGLFAAMANLETTTAGATERLTNLDEARVLMGTVTKDIRTAARPTTVDSPFTRATPWRMDFYGNINTTTGPQLVTIEVNQTTKELFEWTIAPVGAAPPYTYPIANQRRRIVGQWISNYSAVFTYFYLDETTNTLVAFATPPGTDPVALKLIKAVEVKLSVQKTPQISSIPTTLVNRVRLPNVDYNPLPDP